MKRHSRKLHILFQDDAPFQPLATSENSIATSPPLPLKKPIPVPLPAPPPSLQQYYTSPPFETGMALTVIILLTALFFLGFFSIYIRRFSAAPTAEFSSDHHNHRRQRGPSTISDRPSRSTALRKGVDPHVVKSLPAYRYYPGDAKYQIECAICLGEFEERECVKMIPYCKHVFHLECIDTWLRMHCTCPVCRGTQFFEGKGKSVGVGGGDLRVVQDRVDQGASELNGRSSTVGETIIEIREMDTVVGMRRSSSCSCSNFGDGERMSIQRTSSL